jgi:hypothetical protein
MLDLLASSRVRFCRHKLEIGDFAWVAVKESSLQACAALQLGEIPEGR